MKSGRLKTLAAILILFVSLPLSAQRILMLEKPGSGKHYMYDIGDDITMKRDRDSLRFTGTITAIYDSGLIIDMKLWVGIGEVDAVWRKFKHRRSQGNKVMIGGAVLAAIVMINNAAHNDVIVDPVYVGAAAGVAALGALWSMSSVQKYPIGTRWKLKVLDPTFL